MPVSIHTRTQGSVSGSRRRWPLLLIGAAAGTATWSGWVGLGQLTGFGVVHPLPGIWDGATLNTAITLPIGVEAYAVYALSVATDTRPLTTVGRRYAWASAGAALMLGMAGQIAYHLMDAKTVGMAPWWIVAMVSCLPVLVLGAASLLWHLTAKDTEPEREQGVDADEPVSVSVAVTSPVPVAGPVGLAAPAGSSTGTGRVRALVGPTLDDKARATGYALTPGPGTPTTPTRSAAAPAVSAGSGDPGSDEQILAEISGEPPSIRALMRTYGIGQARATRLHRAASRTAAEKAQISSAPARTEPNASRAEASKNTQTSDSEEGTDVKSEKNGRLISRGNEPRSHNESDTRITDRVGQFNIGKEWSNGHSEAASLTSGEGSC
jgi:hypothetical protein